MRLGHFAVKVHLGRLRAYIIFVSYDIFTYEYIHINTHVFMCVDQHILTHTHIHKHTHTHTSTHTHTHTHTQAHTHIYLCVCEYIYTYMYIDIYL